MSTDETVPAPIGMHLARDIMGRQNFIGLDDAKRAFRLEGRLSEQFETACASVPFDEATLHATRDTHVLIVDLGFSISRMRRLTPRDTFDRQPWDPNDYGMCADEWGVPGWRLIKRGLLGTSAGLPWDQQLKCLGPDDEVPSARELTNAMLVTYLTTQRSLYPQNYFIRTRNVHDEWRIEVAAGACGMIQIQGFDRDAGIYGHSIGSARKPKASGLVQP